MFEKRIREILTAHKPIVRTEEYVVPAAVLIPLFVKDNQVQVLLTVRTENVESHKGQISFPGGVCEEADQSRLATALRETQEEVGIRRNDVNILGQLDQLVSTTDFIITPFVGVIPYPYTFNPNRDEIAELVEVPLSFFLNQKNQRTEQQRFRGHSITVHYFNYKQHTVWGVTARILVGFLDLLQNNDSNLLNQSLFLPHS